ncbi:acyl--CoA ligase [Parvularcula flava]|uniref:Acyl--CoA ligase n=1 Tax=Aquisalinus luteolus TaxID=1566827 RepID=A0A8J3A1B7_9PROT|nr:class I adenylate-forming enzyme family protein [Aquisalinus luteolus]NHK26573.1 acyl--CoA ligase [Aquisalinus luteolus]GGH92746.1 fatty acid--CoA ligase [Aquisalinus luteolus]
MTVAPITGPELQEKIDAKLAEGGLFATMPITVRGVEYPRVFAASNMSLRDLMAMKAAEFKDAEFMVYEDERYTIGEVWQKACRLAQVLIGDYGIKPADRVVIAMRNYPEWCIAYLGIIAAGATVVPLNAWWREEELHYGMRDCEARLVIGDAKRLGYLAPVKEEMGLTFIAAREPSEHADADLEDLIANAPSADMPQVAIDADSDFCILYTSGSTGRPKGAMLTHRSVINAVLSWSFLQQVVNELRPDAKIIVENAVILLSLPLFHVTASHSVFLLSWLTGRKIVFMYRWDVDEALRLIKQEKITNLAVVPTQSHEVIEHAKPGDLDTVTDIVTGGAKRPAHHVAEMTDKFPAVRASSGYGLTETNALGCHNGLSEYLAKPDSAGRPIPPVTEFKIFNDKMEEMPPGEVGEICVKSPATFRGYLAMPKETEKALTKDGWFRTGDLGKIDEEGFLYIVDRLKELIIRGGENVSCLEVENEIYKFDGVQETAVFGVPDEKMGEVVGAVVYAGEGKTIDPQALRDFLLQHVAGFKVPEKIWISPQKLPRGSTDKLDKKFIAKTAIQFPPHLDATK